jgi:two-component system, OmpR family, KDP operon response regulator KdpE
MRILIADDDPQMLRALRITLTARGYDVTTAADGTAALDAAIAVHPTSSSSTWGCPASPASR